MNAIVYRPTHENGTIDPEDAMLNCSDPEVVRSALERTFGPFPLDLTLESRDLLEQAGHSHPSEAAFQELVAALESHRSLRVLSA